METPRRTEAGTETEMYVGEGALMSETFQSAVCVAVCCRCQRHFRVQCVAMCCSVLQCMSETFQSSLRADLIDRNWGSKRFIRGSDARNRHTCSASLLDKFMREKERGRM